MKTIKQKERVRCGRCKETLLSTDDGYGTTFLKKDIGKTIVCIRRPKGCGSLHFWESADIDYMREDFCISKNTMGVETTIIKL